MGCIVWAIVLLIAWLLTFVFSWLLSPVALPIWLNTLIIQAMAFVSGIAVFSLFIQVVTTENIRELRKNGCVMMIVGFWLMAAAACIFAIYLHRWLEPYNLSIKDETFCVTLGGLCFASAEILLFGTILERTTKK